MKLPSEAVTPRRFPAQPFVLLIFVAALQLGTTGLLAQRPELRATRDQPREIGGNHLEVELFGGEFSQWASAWRDNAPIPLRFRWRTDFDNAVGATWEIARDPSFSTILARGEAGEASAEGGFAYFTIDFRPIVGDQAQRPLDHYVRIATFGRGPVRAEAASRPALRDSSRPAASATGSARPQGQRTNTDRDLRPIKPPVGLPSPPVQVSIITPHDPTDFTYPGLHPEYLIEMPISIDLRTLKIRGTGGDEDPYLLVTVIYADGTTIVPELDLAALKIRFPDATVRIDSPSKTHENVPVDVDPGDDLAIPAATGHFERSIRPIGMELAEQHGLSAAQRRELRERTLVGILVIGLEEDAQPSTEVMDQTRADLVSNLQTELASLVRGVELSLADPTDIPDLVSAVQRIRADLQQRLIATAQARAIDDLTDYLVIPGFPTVLAIPGMLNADDYIGVGVQVLDYESILNAGENGLPISMRLDQNPDEELYYRIEGRVRVQPRS